MTAVAWVDGRPVDRVDVETRLATARRAPFGALLPDPATAEGRNARRWMVQLVCAEQVVRAEASRRGLRPDAASLPLRLDRALALGGVTAAVLTSLPEARALLGAITSDLDITDDDVRDYYDRNPDLFADHGQSYADAAPTIAADLRRLEGERRFGEWLDDRMHAAVRLAHGFEHPSYPGQPDATHRH